MDPEPALRLFGASRRGSSCPRGSRAPSVRRVRRRLRTRAETRSTPPSPLRCFARSCRRTAARPCRTSRETPATGPPEPPSPVQDTARTRTRRNQTPARSIWRRSASRARRTEVGVREPMATGRGVGDTASARSRIGMGRGGASGGSGAANAGVTGAAAASITCCKSSAKSPAVVYRSCWCFASAFRQTRSSSCGMSRAS